MSYQEKRSIMYLINSLLIFAVYGLYAFQTYRDGDLESINWGLAIVLILPAQTALGVFTQTILTTINAITESEGEPSVVDELDLSIELRSTRNSYYVFLIGFLLSMGTVAADMPLYVMFNSLALTFFLAQMAWINTQLYYYRRGF